MNGKVSNGDGTEVVFGDGALVVGRDDELAELGGLDEGANGGFDLFCEYIGGWFVHDEVIWFLCLEE